MARADEKERESSYREYVTEALRYITENTAKNIGGTYLTKRYTDIINPQKPQKKDTRTGDEIVADLITGLFGKE